MPRPATVTVGALLVTLGPALTTSSSTVGGGPSTAGEAISLSEVEEITVGGSGHATVAIGSPAELTITGPPDAVDQLAVTVDDDELEIEPGPQAAISLSGDEELRYQITVERLSDIRLRDAVSLEADGITGADLDLELDGTTTAAVRDVQVDELDAEVQGTAQLQVTGGTDDLEVDVREAGIFDGTDLLAGTAEVEARDAARVVVNVSTLLAGGASDNAIVEHVGTPVRTEFEVRGAGAVRPATGTLLPAAPSAEPVPATIPGTTQQAGPDAGAPTAPATFEVSMAGRAFNPPVLEVAVGDTVTWINDDDSEHTVTAFDGPFESDILAEGASFAFTFDTPGEYRYRCLIHEEMQGTIRVV